MTQLGITQFRYEIHNVQQYRASETGVDVYSRVMTVTVVVDGETITHRESMMDTPLAWETEIEWYTRRAVYALHEILQAKAAGK
jgi:hypothetical protein